MIRNFFRHMWESIKSLKRNGWMTFASVSAVTITLAMVGVFVAIILNVTKLAEDIANNVRITVFVETNTEKKDMEAVEDALNKITNVSKVTFSSKDEQLEKLTKDYGDSFDLFDGDANPLGDVYFVEANKPENVKKIQQAAAKLPNVEKADYGGEFSDKVFGIASKVKTWGVAGSIILLFVAIFLISNTIRITIMTRKREIQIMRLVGAKNSFIRWPFFIEGAWIGVLGAVIPILVTMFGYEKIYQMLNGEVIKMGYSLMTPSELVPLLIVLMLATGVVIGSLGSVLSMRRFLKI